MQLEVENSDNSTAVIRARTMDGRQFAQVRPEWGYFLGAGGGVEERLLFCRRSPRGHISVLASPEQVGQAGHAAEVR